MGMVRLNRLYLRGEGSEAIEALHERHAQGTGGQACKGGTQQRRRTHMTMPRLKMSALALYCWLRDTCVTGGAGGTRTVIMHRGLCTRPESGGSPYEDRE